VEYFWEKFTDEELLDLKLSDLGLSIKGSIAQELVEQLYCELRAKKLNFKPHVWISDEWFSPDGVPGIAVPFFALHPRLIKLERKMIGYVEGSTKLRFMKLLRHECGHAIDNGYRLRGNRKRVETFGKSSIKYPESYTFKPYSKAYVKHLREGYAQAHPEEDWAETFAVWLTPNSNWKAKYENWPAFSKLKYLDGRMKGLEGQMPVNNSKESIDSLAESNLTLRKYYEKKVLSKRIKDRPFFGKRLKRILSPVGITSGAKILLRKKTLLRKRVAKQAGIYQYEVEPMLKELLKETISTGLFVTPGNKALETQLTELLVQESRRFKRQGRHRIIM
jgi:hypothetical protein